MTMWTQSGVFSDESDAAAAKAFSVGNLKQVFTNEGRIIDWFDAKQAEGRWFLQHATQVKSIWVPYGESNRLRESIPAESPLSIAVAKRVYYCPVHRQTAAVRVSGDRPRRSFSFVIRSYACSLVALSLFLPGDDRSAPDGNVPFPIVD